MGEEWSERLESVITIHLLSRSEWPKQLGQWDVKQVAIWLKLITSKDGRVTVQKKYEPSQSQTLTRCCIHCLDKCPSVVCLSVAAHCRKLGKINPFCYIPIWWDAFVIPKTCHLPLTHRNFNSVGSLENTHHNFLHLISGLFLGVFTKPRKMTVLSCLSVRPSICMEKLGSHWMDFHEI